MATNVGTPEQLAHARLPTTFPLPSFSRAAWGAIAIASLFLGISCWWLTQDTRIPIFDAGLHLSLVQNVHQELSAGHVGKALTLTIPYPPFAYLIGSIGIAIGGASVAAPIIAENIFFVSLLALGCYRLGCRAFGATGGLLAVAFALGSPLIIAQFHVFMIDAPETAMVAVSVWAIVATEGFSRIGSSALAGLAVGLGMLTKEPFVFYVTGVIAVTIARGGWRSWRGLLVFAAVAGVIALPWYVQELSHINELGTGAINAANHAEVLGDIAPERLSVDNLTWYFWNFITFQLWVPLFLFSAVGFTWAIVGFVRRRPLTRLTPELLVGAFVAWLAITETFTHDTRYSMPLLVYFAVLGSGWIVRLRLPWRAIAAGALVLVAGANTLGLSFGVGGTVQAALPGANLADRQRPGYLEFYSNSAFLLGVGQVHDGEMLPMLRALRRNGVRLVAVLPQTLDESDFSAAGVEALAQIAGLKSTVAESVIHLTRRDALFAHGQIEPGQAAPCVRLSDGTGVWIRLGNPEAAGNRDYCPTRDPQYYGP
jgi:4-amino-4-deoxy-L-arabinose transferase-like glycosyltransferase